MSPVRRRSQPRVHHTGSGSTADRGVRLRLLAALLAIAAGVAALIIAILLVRSALAY